MRAGPGVAPLADVSDRQRRDGFSQLVIRGKHPVIPMPMLPRRRDEIGKPVEELKRREVDGAIGSRPRGLAAAAPPDPVGGFVSGQHVADFGYPAVWAAGKAEVKHFQGFNDPPADDRFSVHGNSLALSGDGDARVEQTVEGLPANVEFVFAAYVRCDGAEAVALSVRTPHGEVGSSRYSATDPAVWRHVETAFRLTETAPVTVVIGKEGAGDACVDDAGLVPVWSPNPGTSK